MFQAMTRPGRDEEPGAIGTGFLDEKGWGPAMRTRCYRPYGILLSAMVSGMRNRTYESTEYTISSRQANLPESDYGRCTAGHLELSRLIIELKCGAIDVQINVILKENCASSIRSAPWHPRETTRVLTNAVYVDK
jgi:hypothetical protein